MISHLFPLIPLFILVSCGFLVEPEKSDSRFSSMKQQFKKDASQFGVKTNLDNVIINFGDTSKAPKMAGFIPLFETPPADTLGYCVEFGRIGEKTHITNGMSKAFLGSKNRIKYIRISNSLKDARPEEIEAVVYHELGHCVLHQEHRENSLMEERRASVNDILSPFRPLVLKELFTKVEVEHYPTMLSLNSENIDVRKIKIYKVDYISFSKRFFLEVYKSEEGDTYYYNDIPPEESEY